MHEHTRRTVVLMSDRYTVDEILSALAQKWGSACRVSAGGGIWAAEKREGTSVHLLVAETWWSLDAQMISNGWLPRGTPAALQRVASTLRPFAG